MDQPPADAPRRATAADAVTVATLLHAFNREFSTPTPEPAVLAARIRRLLAGRNVIALLTGEPAVGVAVMTLRPNVWYDGPVALLGELYVAPAMRNAGLGSALLAAVESHARKAGAQLVEINVDGDDVAARRFYERHGYADREAGQPEPALYYSRELGS